MEPTASTSGSKEREPFHTADSSARGADADKQTPGSNPAPPCTKVKVTQSCPTLHNPMDCTVHGIPGHNTGVGTLSLLQEIFPTQGSNPGLPHCGQILYQLSHQRSPPHTNWSSLGTFFIQLFYVYLFWLHRILAVAHRLISFPPWNAGS